jgi:preprotein translocase subunit SecE
MVKQRRVTWPSRQETVRLTIMVLTVAIIVGIFLGIVDAIFSSITGWIMGN